MSLLIKPGLSLIEMLVVLAIISVLFLIPHFGSDRAKEAQIGERGRLDLITIFNCEKRYKLANGGYLITADVAAINSGLGLNLRGGDFNYRIAAGPDGFKAIAKRTGGSLCNGKEMSISSVGGEVDKRCPVW